MQVLFPVLLNFIQHIRYHSFQPHLPAVIGTVDLSYAIVLQELCLFGQDGAAATPEYQDMAAPAFLQQVFNVFEKFYVASLVAGDGHGICIFLNGAFHDFLRRAVVP